MTSQKTTNGMLEIGWKLTTVKGKQVGIKKVLGEGGQGRVFLVDYDGEDKALKWYKQGVFPNPAAFKKNLERNVNTPSPAREFIWPIDLVEIAEGHFGYVMDVRPNGYYEAIDFFLHTVYFPSFKRTIDACLNIVSAFRLLHNKGYVYRDINGGNFFIDPNSGKVLICDNDNVGDPTLDTGIIGTPRFMAPEIVTGKAVPNTKSDLYSLSVLLFFLICLNHPLEGKRSLLPVLDNNHQRALYGSDPIFIMDPNDSSNAPDPSVHTNVLAIWDYLPSYMRDIFIRAFSREVLFDPARRVNEYEWIQQLTRFRSDIYRCDCGNEVFMEEGAPTLCEHCGKQPEVPYKLTLRKYDMPIVFDSRIYKCQVQVCGADDALDPIAQVIRSKENPNMLGILNMSDTTWSAVTASGKQRQLAPKQIMPVLPGIQFTIGNETMQIVPNR